MQIEASEEYFNSLYLRARASYARCINNNENVDLQNEVAIPLAEIAVRDESVKIVFHRKSIDEYLLEVELSLYANGSYMGRYTYGEDKKGDAVEDGLVFY